MSDDRFEKGMAMRRSVLGADHVARAEANKTEEVLLRDSVYAGLPTANSAFAIAKRVYKELQSEAAA